MEPKNLTTWARSAVTRLLVSCTERAAEQIRERADELMRAAAALREKRV